MNKIPVQNEDLKNASDVIAPRFLREALEVLLLGSLWLFVLVWMPFYQSQSDAGVPDAVLRLQWISSLGLSLTAMLLRWSNRQESRFFRWEYLSLIAVAILSVGALWPGNTDGVAGVMEGICIAQALLGLVYFVMGRVQSQ
ncbi:MAG: hypothetical protein D9N11_14850 [Ketobacter sp.]|nr:MAG: hypothetical protein D9N11_14850 [Ketobacter sp.]